MTRAVLILTLVSLLLGAVPLPAGETVHFRNGRRMRVAASERDGSLFILRMENGGVIRVPAATVASIEADPEPEPEEQQNLAAPDTGKRVEDFITSKQAGHLHPLIRQAAEAHQLEEALLVAVIFAESAFNPAAVSPKGAMGLMQLMPDTATRFNVKKPFDPWENLNGGAAYLRQLSDKYGGDLKLALAAYNAGEGRVQHYQGMPPFSETVNYVSRVIGLYNTFRGAE